MKPEDITAPINPLQFYLTNFTIEFYKDIYLKYDRIARLTSQDIHTTICSGMATILKNTPFTFYKMLEDIHFNYDLEFQTIRDEYDKILCYMLDGEEVTFTADYIEIGNRRVAHEEYGELIPYQDYLIEFVALALLKKRTAMVHKRLQTTEFPNKNKFNIEEAVAFTGYAQSYIYKLKSLGKLRAHQGKKNGKLTFFRKDLERLMYERGATGIEDNV
ncbi:hypothetical protein PP178_04325 [Zeaxanthinibacter sp. PT1]|uniref:hypothetical protein n=1 Tax=Zeaxanthinibacter TaxID=561554 RepID=UPI0023492E66|nr:hypothetical protein [Zeaxanthinibacter sp. PT1]MDC6350766.1 hypothetical protein [Zeaxanthinibacter sp. PT1]